MKRALVLAVLGSIILCSCDIKMVTTEETEETLPVIATTAAEEEPEPQPFPVTVNGVMVEESPERVVCLSSSYTEILFEMGYGEKIVGRGSYCDYPEEVSAITDVGRPTKPDLDGIIALRPQILFTATSIPVKDQYKLEENGIKVIYISQPSTTDELKRIYSAFGLIFEGTFDGEAVGDKAYGKIEEAVSASEADLGEFIYITEGLTVATGDTFEDSFLSAFGTNIGSDGTNYAYPKEYLVEFQPELILLNDDYTIDDLLADEIYCRLEAVADGKVYSISNSYFERPSARLTELVDILNDIN